MAFALVWYLSSSVHKGDTGFLIERFNLTNVRDYFRKFCYGRGHVHELRLVSNRIDAKHRRRGYDDNKDTMLGVPWLCLNLFGYV